MQFHSHANQSHFDNNGFALRLALKQRHKGTRKWPIGHGKEIRKADVSGVSPSSERMHSLHSTTVCLESYLLYPFKKVEDTRRLRVAKGYSRFAH